MGQHRAATRCTDSRCGRRSSRLRPPLASSTSAPRAARLASSALALHGSMASRAEQHRARGQPHSGDGSRWIIPTDDESRNPRDAAMRSATNALSLQSPEDTSDQRAIIHRRRFRRADSAMKSQTRWTLDDEHHGCRCSAPPLDSDAHRRSVPLAAVQTPPSTSTQRSFRVPCCHSRCLDSLKFACCLSWIV